MNDERVWKSVDLRSVAPGVLMAVLIAAWCFVAPAALGASERIDGRMNDRINSRVNDRLTERANEWVGALEFAEQAARRKVPVDSRRRLEEVLQEVHGERADSQQPTRALGGVIRVGSGAGCDYSELRIAIAEAPSGSLIEAEGGRTFAGSPAAANSAFLVESKSLTIIGGYSAACDGTQVEERTTLVPGAEGQRVLEVSGAGGPYYLDLVAVALRDGSHPVSGGGLAILNNTSVALLDTWVVYNQAPAGAGVMLLGGAGGELFLARAVVGANEATVGGGVFCGNGEVTLAGVFLSYNVATEDGGGLYAADCQVESVSISDSENGFLANQARRGGGAALSGLTDFRLVGTADQRQSFGGNVATEDGGAVYSEGNGSLLFDGVDVVFNSADRGGGIFLTGNADALLRGWNPDVPASRCLRAPCALWESNEATTGGFAFLEGEAVAEVAHGVAKGNSAETGAFWWSDSQTGSLIGSTVIESSGSLAPGAALFDLHGGLWAFHVTTTDNIVESIFRMHEDGFLAVRNSIVWEASDVHAYQQSNPPQAVAFECNLVHDPSTLPAGHLATFSDDPLFIPGSHAHLEADSPAIDRCLQLGGFEVDFDGEDRPPLTDAGADHRTGIFFGNFEINDTSRWSATTP